MEYTLRVRRYQPDAVTAEGEPEGPFWQDFTVDLEESLSVLDGLLHARSDHDGSLAVRCSCRAAICGSCGVKINGESALACKTQLRHAQDEANRQGRPAGDRVAPGREAEEATRPIVVEPMANMPVVKDLVTDMESTHWAKVRRVTPWLLPDPVEEAELEREHVVPPDSMIDITQTMACIQCGACVSSCLALEADPEFIGPAALAKAYRFVGDPRDAETRERLWDLAQDPHGIYDCTHCFACIEACPKGVAPMDQIMRLRRAASGGEEITDQNNGANHEHAFVKIIEKKGTLDESLLLQESYAPGLIGKLRPRAIKDLLISLPTAVRGIRTGKMRSLSKLIPGVHAKLPGDAQDHVKRIYAHAEEHAEELNTYIAGEEEDEMSPPDLPSEPTAAAASSGSGADPGTPGRDSGGGAGQ